ncbi:MAG TPA: hypothetical protein VF006_02990 [Longimicrobium sp.]
MDQLEVARGQTWLEQDQRLAGGFILRVLQLKHDGQGIATAVCRVLTVTAATAVSARAGDIIEREISAFTDPARMKFVTDDPEWPAGSVPPRPS